MRRVLLRADPLPDRRDLLCPLVGGDGFLGWPRCRLSATAVALGFEAVIYGLTLAFLYRALMVPLAGASTVASRPGADPAPNSSCALGFGVAALVIGAGAIIGLTHAGGATGSERWRRVGNDGLPPEITPNDDFLQRVQELRRPECRARSAGAPDRRHGRKSL